MKHLYTYDKFVFVTYILYFSDKDKDILYTVDRVLIEIRGVFGCPTPRFSDLVLLCLGVCSSYSKAE